MTPYHYIRNTWYVAGLSAEFEKEELQGQKIAGRSIVLWRTRDGEVVAFDNRCVHKRMPLSSGRLTEDGTLECAYHGLCFNPKGTCVDIPSQPDTPIPPQANLKPIPVVEQDGAVWVWPGDPALSDTAKPPRMPELVDSEWEAVPVSEPMQVPTNYLLLIENLLDITHFYPLHDGNIGDVANSRIPIELDEGEEDGNRFVRTTRRTQGYKQPPFLADWFVYDVVDRLHTHKLVSPGLTRVEMQVAPPGELGGDKDRGYILYHTHTPVDERNHVWRICVCCKADHRPKGDPSVSTAKRVAQMFPEVAAQDLWALEKQQEMFDYPDDGYSELHLKPDTALRRARQIFAAQMRKEQAERPKTAASA